MKRLRVTLLTLYLFIGILVPSCDWFTDDCDCSGYQYFDVEGLDLQAFVNEAEGRRVEENETLRLSDFEGFYLDYLVTYHARAERCSRGSFNLLSPLLACSCLPGGTGSKTEELVAFTITTLNDFDADHPAGSSLNDVFLYQGSYFNTGAGSLVNFLDEEGQRMLTREDIRLRPDRAPTLDSVLHLQMTLELNQGETYTVESVPFVLLPN